MDTIRPENVAREMYVGEPTCRDEGEDEYYFICSECNVVFEKDFDTIVNFCPSCGARVIG